MTGTAQETDQEPLRAMWRFGPKQVAIGAIGALLLVYTAVRACTVSFSWDEAYTFTHHVSKGKFFQDTFDMMGANHHLLNVWLMWLSMKMFGDGEFALRLPNLLAHVLYLYGSARIASKASSMWLAIAAFVLMNAHPYLLDFFSLARGYGLANGFIMMSLWCVLRYFSEGRSRAHAGWAMFWAALAALANTIALNYLLGLAVAFVLWWAMEVRSEGIKARIPHMLMVIAVVGAVLALLLPTVLKLSENGSLHMGCERLWDGTVATFGEKFLYHNYYGSRPLTLMGWILGAMAVWWCVVLIRSLRKDMRGTAGTWLFAATLLLAILLCMFVQHQWLHVPWPRSRTALFLLPLLLFMVALPLVQWSPRRWLPPVVAALFCAPVLVHMAVCWNTTCTIEWKGSGDLQRILRVLAADHAPLSRQRPIVTLTTGDENLGPLPYYVATREMRWLSHIGRNAPDPFTPSDYYIVEYDGFDQVDQRNWTLLYRSEVCNTSLYRDERFRSKVPITVYHGSRDMESPDLPGACLDHHVSGRQCLRIDPATRWTESIAWKVPEGWDSANVLATGTMMVRQLNDQNWLSLWLSVERDGKTIEKRDLASSTQMVQYERWNLIGVELRTSVGLRAGDVITFATWPSSPDATFHVDDMDLWILRE